MSSKQCSKCDKTVYPLEELKCLDKLWHKACFRCQECAMQLNMRNYKGFNRQPYCNAHCPVAKHTTVADTPEIRRIQENTKLQSQAKYHEDFEKSKGKVTQIADDPEIKRVTAHTKVISNAAYHGDLEKKASMEQRRPAGDGENVNYDPNTNQTQYIQPPPNQIPKHYQQQAAVVAHLNNQNQQHHPPPHHPLQQHQQQQQIQPPQTYQHHRMRSAEDYPPTAAPPLQMGGAYQQYPQQGREQQGRAGSYVGGGMNNHQQVAKDSPYSAARQGTSTLIYSSEHGPVSNPSRKVGSIADYDPVNDNYGSMVGPGGYPQQQNNQYRINAAGDGNHGIAYQAQSKPKGGMTYRAMYDYTAADSDEVSFLDGDVIINCSSIDEGWMTGQVQRTGASGMLPANYVEPMN